MSIKNKYICPECGHELEGYQNPAPVADIIIEIGESIVLIKRKFEPHGWAIPGGFVDYGETVERAAVREAKEETSLDVELLHLLGVYSDPSRDIRKHTISTVFVAGAEGKPIAADDAESAALFTCDRLPSPLVFDHDQILQDYFTWKKTRI
jgi:ADP-ribose pyrophosphatase YjhB (NUDIX family)